MEKKTQEILKRFHKQLSDCDSTAALDKLSTGYLGRKGVVTSMLRDVGKLSADERPLAGKLANQLKQWQELMRAVAATYRAGGRATLDEPQLNRLREIGYIQ